MKTTSTTVKVARIALGFILVVVSKLAWLRHPQRDNPDSAVSVISVLMLGGGVALAWLAISGTPPVPRSRSWGAVLAWALPQTLIVPLAFAANAGIDAVLGEFRWGELPSLLTIMALIWSGLTVGTVIDGFRKAE